jgi:plasmid stabilization system protein ParE
MGLIFHRLIKRDLRTIMTHYEEEVGPELAARFQREFEEVALRIEQNPRRFHIISGVLRRANFPSFPYHLLYREMEAGARVLVLRHHRRKPDYGTRRQ